jgi:uncharacterized membrane protein YagU involved in acid resistance
MNASMRPLDRNAGTNRGAVGAILAGGLIAGTLDIGAAALINLLDPRIILRFIAGGVLGQAALRGGAAVAWLGLLLQWAMSLVIAAIFVLAALRFRRLAARWIAAGLAYGIVIFAVMNYVVMPLSAWHRANHFSPGKFAENLAAMLLFGLVVSFFARRCLGNPPHT